MVGFEVDAATKTISKAPYMGFPVVSRDRRATAATVVTVMKRLIHVRNRPSSRQEMYRKHAKQRRHRKRVTEAYSSASPSPLSFPFLFLFLRLVFRFSCSS